MVWQVPAGRAPARQAPWQNAPLGQAVGRVTAPRDGVAEQQPGKLAPVMNALASGAQRADVPAGATDACRRQLNGLAQALVHLGLRVSLLESPGRMPTLHVVNPEASVLAEDVYALSGQDGSYSFWWSWSERIAPGDDPEGAAALIKRVLAARG